MKNLAIFLVVVFFLSGCATIFSGSTQKVNVTTEQNKVYHVTINGMETAVPATIEVARKGAAKVISVKECPEQKVLFEKKLNPVFLLDVLATSPLSTTVDAITGAMWKYEPADIKIDCATKN